ncbi:MAG: 3-methyl-2-oxobutanoate hydroxymethyltransferase [Planctomycetota bacterium]
MSSHSKSPNSESRPRVGIRDLLRWKEERKPFSVLTAYDAPTARILHEAGIPLLLIGDSVGNVMLGYRDTVPVTMEEMLHHCRAVRRGAPDAFLIGDLPFLSYQISADDAVRNAGAMVKDGGVDAVKLEGGAARIEVVTRIVEAGIPVMGHLGLTPQSATLLGGMRSQANHAERAKALVDDARALEEAGVFSLVLECIPREVAARVTETLGVPTVGIGAGPDCDGQVLVTQDLLGFGGEFRPKFVRQYETIETRMREAVSRFRSDVEERSYPNDDESFHMKASQKRAFDESFDGE